MRWSRHAVIERPGVVGAVRIDRSSVRLLARVEAGDVAVLDHLDLDALTAEGLVLRGVAAVVNACPSTSGRYPNLGPQVLMDAGIPLLDAVGDQVFGSLRDGSVVRVDGDTLWRGDQAIATGVRQDQDSVAAATAMARAGLAAQLADLVSNTTGFLLDERDLLLEGRGVPVLRTALADRSVLVVAPGHDAAAELALLRSWRRKHRPVVVAVDGAADVLQAAGVAPDLLVGDPRWMSDEALSLANEVVGGPDSARCQELGVRLVAFDTAASSEDMALLLADWGGASLVVTAGFPNSLEQLLDRGRAGGSSALLVRAGLGDRVVGARAAATLARRRFPRWAILLLVLLAAAVSLGVLAATGHQLTDVDLSSLRGTADDDWQAFLRWLPW